MNLVTVRGAKQWRELVGKTVSFEWEDGWDSYPYSFEDEIESVTEIPDEYSVYVNFKESGSVNVGEHFDYRVRLL